MEEFKEVTTYGVLFAGTQDDDRYYLLSPRPVELDNWLKDDERCFYVCEYENLLTTQRKALLARYIIVRGDYLIDFANAGRRVKIQKQEVTPLDKLDEKIEQRIEAAVSPV